MRSESHDAVRAVRGRVEVGRRPIRRVIRAPVSLERLCRPDHQLPIGGTVLVVVHEEVQSLGNDRKVARERSQILRVEVVIEDLSKQTSENEQTLAENARKSLGICTKNHSGIKGEIDEPSGRLPDRPRFRL